MYAKEEQIIRNFQGVIIGRIYTLHNGDKEVRDFSGKCLGRYIKARDITTTFTGKIIAHGEALSLLLKQKG